MSRNDSTASSEAMNSNKKRLVTHILSTPSKIPVPVKSTVVDCVKKQKSNGGGKKTANKIHLGKGPVKITEPHQLPSPESCPFVPTTGSKGDHVRGNTKPANTGDKWDGMIYSLNFLVEPRFVKQGISFHQMHSSFPGISEQDESLGMKNKGKSNIKVGDCDISPINEDNNNNISKDVIMEDLELGYVSKQQRKTAEVVPEDQKEAIESTTICKIFPQVLLLIPDINRPGGYSTQLHIVNKSKNLLAYKVCLNQTADVNYNIKPMYGIIEALGRVLIQITSRRQDGDLPGGFSQKFTKKDRLEIKTIESVGVANKKELYQFWNIAELKYSKFITTTVIDTIKVLEPFNMAMLKAIDEGPERDFLQKALEDKYKKVLFPQMIENRECHSIENELTVLENRTKSFWKYIHLTIPWLILGLFIAAIFVIVTFPNSSFRIPTYFLSPS